MSVSHKTSAISLLIAVGLLAACGGGGGGGGGGSTPTTSSTGSSSSASSAASSAGSAASSSTASSSSSSSGTSSSAASITSLGASGWATYGTGTTGGDGATKTYTVSTRAGLIQALYGNAATINSDGSFSGTLDSSKKIIYISGTISLSQNGAGTELAADDYVKASCAYSTEGYTTADALYTAYKNAYNPQTWATGSSNTAPDSTSSQLVSGKPAYARTCAMNQQKKVVQIFVPSNTSIIGLGSTAKIIHGNLMLGTSSAPVDNIVIRNITFEDAFDFFPAWDSTDSTTGRWNTNYDLISVLYATHVWIDHNEFSDGARPDDLYPSVWTGTASDGSDYASNEVFKFMHHDGAVDITKTANYVTVSYNYIHDHDKTDLIGGTDSASTSAENPNALKVTFHHNYWKNCKQRQPRVRYGMAHIYNNYYSNNLAATTVYGWSVAWYAGQGAKLYVEANAVDVSGVSAASAVYGGSSSSSKASSCATTMGSGYDSNYCSAFMYVASTNLLNGNGLGAQQDLSASGVTTSNTPWFASGVTSGTPGATPSSYYAYTLDSANTLATTVPASAGVGKL